MQRLQRTPGTDVSPRPETTDLGWVLWLYVTTLLNNGSFWPQVTSLNEDFEKE